MTSVRTALCGKLGIEAPVFGFVHSVEAAAEVSRNGGFGIYGATRDTPEEIRDNLKQLREMVGDRRIGVDLVLPPDMPERDDRGAHMQRSHSHAYGGRSAAHGSSRIEATYAGIHRGDHLRLRDQCLPEFRRTKTLHRKTIWHRRSQTQDHREGK